ncbi:MAG: acyl-CoA synthetase [Alphaproteobacteria bacterium]|nr:MAG: acyl-CoA synthetase [Alphaproteobacteria bacterium]
MHPCIHAQSQPDKPAFIMARTGETVTYRELEDRSNQVAQYFRSIGLKKGDAIAIFMENNSRFFELCWGAHRCGLFYTCISSRLTAEEVDYIVGDCGARAFATSIEKKDVAGELASLMPKVEHRLMVGGVIDGYESFEDVVGAMPPERIADETAGADMLYSSGTTGRPKGVRVQPPTEDITDAGSLLLLVGGLYGFTPETIYLSPAPLYHAAPLRYNLTVQRLGGTCVVMDHFDPEEALQLIEKYKVTASQWVPTMFVRMLKLPKEVRTKYNLSSHQVAIHAAAPCPIPVKKEMIEWWGPIIHEYYAGTEGNGFCAINSEEWLTHEGSVGKSMTNEIHILDEEGNECPPGESGSIYFADEGTFEYFNDPDKTKESRNDRGWSTLGDVGYLDEEGYLYLTDRKAFMIISGGVNIYPQEIENLIITMDKVADVAVIGVPNEDFGEEVKAVVQPMKWSDQGPDLAEEVVAYCKKHLSSIKCPRSVDFMEELPRHPTGKLYKRLIRDRYWGDHKSKIV